MLNKLGNSSRLVDLKNLPNFVNLSSSINRLPFSSFSLVIVLNLYKLKIFSFKPGLACLKIIGEPNLILTKNAINKKIGESKTKAIEEITKSKKRLK
jgi:hypothetical protein